MMMKSVKNLNGEVFRFLHPVPAGVAPAPGMRRSACKLGARVSPARIERVVVPFLALESLNSGRIYALVELPSFVRREIFRAAVFL